MPAKALPSGSTVSTRSSRLATGTSDDEKPGVGVPGTSRSVLNIQSSSLQTGGGSTSTAREKKELLT